MTPILMETAAGSTDSTSGIFEYLTSIFTFIVGLVGDFVNTITTTPLLFVPVIIGFAGGAIMLGVSVVHRLGVGSGGRRRARGRR